MADDNGSNLILDSNIPDDVKKDASLRAKRMADHLDAIKGSSDPVDEAEREAFGIMLNYFTGKPWNNDGDKGEPIKSTILSDAPDTMKLTPEGFWNTLEGIGVADILNGDGPVKKRGKKLSEEEIAQWATECIMAKRKDFEIDKTDPYGSDAYIESCIKGNSVDLQISNAVDNAAHKEAVNSSDVPPPDDGKDKPASKGGNKGPGAPAPSTGGKPGTSSGNTRGTGTDAGTSTEQSDETAEAAESAEQDAGQAAADGGQAKPRNQPAIGDIGNVDGSARWKQDASQFQALYRLGMISSTQYQQIMIVSTVMDVMNRNARSYTSSLGMHLMNRPGATREDRKIAKKIIAAERGFGRATADLMNIYEAMGMSLADGAKGYLGVRGDRMAEGAAGGPDKPGKNPLSPIRERIMSRARDGKKNKGPVDTDTFTHNVPGMSGKTADNVRNEINAAAESNKDAQPDAKGAETMFCGTAGDVPDKSRPPLHKRLFRFVSASAAAAVSHVKGIPAKLLHGGKDAGNPEAENGGKQPDSTETAEEAVENAAGAAAATPSEEAGKTGASVAGTGTAPGTVEEDEDDAVLEALHQDDGLYDDSPGGQPAGTGTDGAQETAEEDSDEDEDDDAVLEALHRDDGLYDDSPAVQAAENPPPEGGAAAPEEEQPPEPEESEDLNKKLLEQNQAVLREAGYPVDAIARTAEAYGIEHITADAAGGAMGKKPGLSSVMRRFFHMLEADKEKPGSEERKTEEQERAGSDRDILEGL